MRSHRLSCALIDSRALSSTLMRSHRICTYSNLYDSRREFSLVCPTLADSRRELRANSHQLTSLFGPGFRLLSSEGRFERAKSDVCPLTLYPPIAAPYPSKKCQQLFGQLCVKDNQLANEFLNGLLNQLNWSFSEFIGMLQEVYMVFNQL